HVGLAGAATLSADDSQGEPDQLRAIRLDKLNALKQAGADPFSIERFDRTHLPGQIVDEAAPHWTVSDVDRETMIVRAAGRITAQRPKGKVTFADIRDQTGRVQLYVKRDELGE